MQAGPAGVTEGRPIRSVAQPRRATRRDAHSSAPPVPGGAVRNIAYFLGSAFEPERRRSCERDLLIRYHRALAEDYGVSDYPFDHCWRDYVRSSYGSLLMAVFASMMVGRTDRGDAMFMAMANRSAQMAADLDAQQSSRGAEQLAATPPPDRSLPDLA